METSSWLLFFHKKKPRNPKNPKNPEIEQFHHTSRRFWGQVPPTKARRIPKCTGATPFVATNDSKCYRIAMSKRRSFFVVGLVRWGCTENTVAWRFWIINLPYNHIICIYKNMYIREFCCPHSFWTSHPLSQNAFPASECQLQNSSDGLLVENSKNDQPLQVSQACFVYQQVENSACRKILRRPMTW